MYCRHFLVQCCIMKHKLASGECKEQQHGVDDNMISIFILKVWRLRNTLHQLGLCVSTKHQTHFARQVQQLDSWCCVADGWGHNSFWIPVIWLAWDPFVHFLFCYHNKKTGAALDPSLISMPLIPTLSRLPGAEQPVRLHHQKMLWAVTISKFAVLHPKHTQCLHQCW